MKQYRIGKPIGYGASATILEAWRPLPDGTEQPIAVKRLLPEYRDNREITSRFEREATLCLEITHDHPNLVSVYDFQRLKNGELLMVMERVDGVSLDRLPALSWPAIRYVLRECARALDFVHAHGVLHRDISPRNILGSSSGAIKILDFGLARWLNTPRSDLGFKGTAPYASPEAIQCLDLDASADLYSLAAVGYQLVTGKPPYGAGDAVQISRRMVMTKIAPLAENVPKDLSTLIMALLQPWEERTIRTATQVLEGLGEPVAHPQEIASIVKDVRDAGMEPRSDNREHENAREHGEPIGDVRDSRTRRAALVLVGLLASGLMIYMTLAPGRKAATNGSPVPADAAIHREAIQDSPVAPDRKVIKADDGKSPIGPTRAEVESNTTEPSKPVRSQDAHPTRRTRPDRMARPSSEMLPEQGEPGQAGFSPSTSIEIEPAGMPLPAVTGPAPQEDQPRWVRTEAKDGAQRETRVKSKGRVETRAEDRPSGIAWPETRAAD